ncbi:AAA family ATPase [bacterium]|nr:AAA family ATPase [bacterium]
MKIAITGKGGVGKSTFAGLLCRMFAAQEDRVLAIDADPDSNLASALGCPTEISSKIKPISQLKNLIKERMEINIEKSFFKLNPKVDDLLEKYSYQCFENLRLVVMGEVKKGGSGCYCPENNFLKNFFSHLLIEQKNHIIMDMEAGIEHLSRGTAYFVDAIIIVVEPGKHSLQTAKSIIGLSKDLGINKIFIVGNKILNDTQKKMIYSNFINYPVILGLMSYDQDIILYEENEKSLFESNLPIVSEVALIKHHLEREIAQ